MTKTLRSTEGQPLPLGNTVTDDGINFAIFSRNATHVWLLLFDEPTDNEPSHIIDVTHRTGDIWHIHVDGLKHGQLYLYQINGPYEPLEGHRFNQHKGLLDPYAKALTGFEWDFSQAFGYDIHSRDGDLSFSTVTDLAGLPKCIAYGPDGFDWQGDRPINRPLSETIVYETHVRSLTSHPSADVEHPGTFRGVIEKIPYLVDLGVTAVELLPIHQFYEHEFERYNPLNNQRLINYWGYNTLSFFAPHYAYSHLPTDRGQQIVAFKEMVRELHKANIEVILDVVFNHTVEGDHTGPMFHFSGIDNTIYYMLENDKRFYRNFSGVGNTLNCNHPIVQDFIIDCLRYWVREMHVDGFRFDLATILSRDPNGNIPADPPLPIRIAEDPILRDTKMIAEPWDIGGYQVGHFPGSRWAEWNDKYRDEIRQFWRGDPGLTGALAQRFSGSADLYYHSKRKPNFSINFVAAHDGFTINDVVSYNYKHNEANGEDNRDGHNHNISYNFGHEGLTIDPGIEGLRSKIIKNYWVTLLLSQGTPMINGGDEFRRTQMGNNNAYCQNNEISWYDWHLVEKHAGVHRFAKSIIALRKAHPVFRRKKFFTGSDIDGDRFPDICWYDWTARPATWSADSRSLMLTLDGSKEVIGANRDDVDVLIMFNTNVR
ncbi:MAG: glycogen debranching protein GlgX, partial [Anaerolineae bacterium]|nr:glycogen debranching protein GlgX [Anaerolineae bacterium]